eukprot:15441617-Alexandrium_andersonii.AAC.1
MYTEAKQWGRPALSRARTASAYPGTSTVSSSAVQPTGNTMATPPGCRVAVAPAMEASVRAPGSTAAHSAAACSSQCVSCRRHGRPRSSWRTITARLAAALRVSCATSQRRFHE